MAFAKAKYQNFVSKIVKGLGLSTWSLDICTIKIGILFVGNFILVFEEGHSLSGSLQNCVLVQFSSYGKSRFSEYLI